MENRRSFLIKSTLGLTSLPSLKVPNAEWLNELANYKPKFLKDEVVNDEDYWSMIRQAYTVSPQIINLNNGGVSPAPKVVQDALDHYNKIANDAPSYYMWRIMDQGREPLRENLAKFAGVLSDEIAINRNATESIDTVILGLPLQKGDEIVLSKYDYPNMLHAWRQREARDGVVLNYIEIDLPLENEDLIVKKYLDKITPKTKVIHLTHIVNWNGQILPVRRIATEAKKRGVEVLVDGAHSFAHLNYKITDLNCDYYGTSLHKWLSAPIGSGMLWVKKEKISKIFPLIPNGEPSSENIRKFENLGTRSFPIEQAVGQALNFQLAIGNERKEARLRYLKDYWAKEAAKIPKIIMNTPLNPNQSCALAHVGFEGIESSQIEAKLFEKFKIHTSPVKWEKLNGVRITPHVYTAIRELDKLLEGLHFISKMG
ncbi:MAG: aminotransferase class V-fold PLP-dependent enzyme [Bacteroidota bacterium]